MNKDKWGNPVVPCQYCGNPTPMLGTKLCDGCWELRRHIRGNPELAAKILKENQK